MPGRDDCHAPVVVQCKQLFVAGDEEVHCSRHGGGKNPVIFMMGGGTGDHVGDLNDFCHILQIFHVLLYIEFAVVGMRGDLAASLLREPPLLYLDEPTSGSIWWQKRESASSWPN